MARSKAEETKGERDAVSGSDLSACHEGKGPERVKTDEELDVDIVVETSVAVEGFKA